MADYDPKILQKSADDLYSRAESIVATYIGGGLVLGIALGGGLAGVLAKVRSDMDPSALAIMAILTGVLGSAVGWAQGSAKAFWLKLEAQRTLCQLQIEKNTRGGRETASPEPRAAS